MVTAHDAFGYFGRLHGLEVVGLQGLSTEDEIGLSDINGTIDILFAAQGACRIRRERCQSGFD